MRKAERICCGFGYGGFHDRRSIKAARLQDENIHLLAMPCTSSLRDERCAIREASQIHLCL